MKTDLDIIAEQCAEIDRRNGNEPLPSVRSEPLLAALIEAGDRLAPFLGHPRSCEWEMQGGKSCQCGLIEKWAAWKSAKRTAERPTSGA